MASATESPDVEVKSTSFADLEGSLFSSARKRSVVLSLLLLLLTLAVYNPVVHNGFVNIDDNGYVTDNQHVHNGLSWGTVKWAFTTFDCENWHPLTWLSHALDWELFGKNAAGHHYTSVLLHAINAILLFLLLQSATGFTWRSLIVAVLFALHPVDVESVAWASERKNVLSMTFFLLTMLAYGWYAQRPAIRRYSLVALMFACGLMAKPQVITLPCVLLLWDYWPLHRFGFGADSESSSRFPARSLWWLTLEKMPLLLLSAGDALLTMQAQKHAVRGAQAGYSVAVRFGNAALSYARYVGHAFWPVHLSPAYAHPGATISWSQVVVACGFLLLVSVLVLASHKRYLLVGWLWFLGILVPMIGIVQVGDQAMADRYAYIPYIGLFWMVTWSLAEASRDWKISSRWLAAPLCAVLIGSAFLTQRQIGYWHDGETLWRYALRVTDKNFMAHCYLAAVLTKEERHEEAMVEYVAADQLHRYPLDQIVLFADYELRHEHTSEAMKDAQRVLDGTDDRQSREMAYRDLGIGNTKLGKTAEARTNFQNALQIDPNDPFVLMGMGLLDYRYGDFASAADYFSRAVKSEPSDFEYLLLATALEKSGRQAEASAAYAQAQRMSQDFDHALQKANYFLSN
jgi:Flp pilus assembly protein TadD